MQISLDNGAPYLYNHHNGIFDTLKTVTISGTIVFAYFGFFHFMMVVYDLIALWLLSVDYTHPV